VRRHLAEQFFTAVISFCVAYFCVSAYLSSLPPIDVRYVGFDDQTSIEVEYDRRVRVGGVIRVVATNDLVLTATEESVKECLRSKRVDFSQAEANNQRFQFAAFFTPNCWDAVGKGIEYEIYTVLTPTDGGAVSTYRSVPYILKPKGEK